LIRVILWAEHATIGARRFSRSERPWWTSRRSDGQTKPYEDPGPSRFPSGLDFEWPILPGHEICASAPAKNGRMDHIGCLMEESREDEFITAIHTERNVLIGYVFPPGFPLGAALDTTPRTTRTPGGSSSGCSHGDQGGSGTDTDVRYAHVPPLPAKSKLKTRF
jgi:hypothetical protein